MFEDINIEVCVRTSWLFVYVMVENNLKFWEHEVTHTTHRHKTPHTCVRMLAHMHMHTQTQKTNK